MFNLKESAWQPIVQHKTAKYHMNVNATVSSVRSEAMYALTWKSCTYDNNTIGCYTSCTYGKFICPDLWILCVVQLSYVCRKRHQSKGPSLYDQRYTYLILEKIHLVKTKDADVIHAQGAPWQINIRGVTCFQPSWGVN